MADEANRLTAAQVAEELDRLPGWAGDEDEIMATFAMATFPTAIELVRQVAEAAEEANHHPDIDIRWRNVTFRLTTHDAGGVTSKDAALASRIQSAAEALGWEA